jgi:cytidylate kinase
VDKQRAYAGDNDIVMEGRDIGSVVFPNTPYKFYVDASPEVRAMRRARQGLADSIAQRDKFDSSRRTSPLIIAEDAHVLDSSHLTIDGVVGEIIGRLKLAGLKIEESRAVVIHA